MKLERTKNSLRNLVWGMINKIVGILLPFFVRTVFIKYLGANYLGMNSLFTSILTVLNLAELGLSNAIVYNMYKPIADGETDEVCALLNFYKKAYRGIGIFVGLIGILLIPFLEYFVNGSYPAGINIVIVYCVYLANTVSSYFLFAYKNCILTAYQREDIISKINLCLKTLMYLLQIIFLIYYKSYYLYIFISFLNTVLTNIVVAYYSSKYYPEYKAKGIISDNKIAIIKKNVRGLFIGKLCIISRNSLDNIFLSMFLGLKIVTIYSNYFYIMNAVSSILILIMTSISAGIGNSVATESVEKNFDDFSRFVFMYQWLSGVCTVCLFCLFQPFMKLWMGESLMFPMIDVILICFYFYCLTMGDVKSQFTSALGLFWENRFCVLLEATSNLILNFLLVSFFGVHGIIIATIISIFAFNFLLGSMVLYKYYFNQYNLKEYYMNHLFYLIVAFIASLISFAVCKVVVMEGLFGLLIKGLICLVISNLVYFVFFRKTKIFQASIKFVSVNIIKNQPY